MNLENRMSSVDVIVPCYRYGHFLRECVESVLSQNGVQVRVLIIDDASPDDTEIIGQTLAREDSRVIFRRHTRNIGHIATYNEGLAWATADHLLLLSADDYLLPGALQRAATLLDQNPGMSFAFGNAAEWKYQAPRPAVSPIELNDSQARIMRGLEFFYACRVHDIVFTPTAVVRTAAQKKAGGYRPQLPHVGDLEMWWRLAALGDVGMLQARQAVYRRHASNMSANYLGMPDIDQREVAIRGFVESLGTAAEKRKLERILLRGTAQYAVDWANNAFITGAHEMQQTLLQRAVALDPSVRFTASWLKLACKRMLGQSACKFLLSRFAPGSFSATLIRSQESR